MPARSINSSLISAATQPQAEPGVGPQVAKRSHPHWARAALTFASLAIIVGYRLLLLWRGGHPLFHDGDPARLFYEALLMSRGEVIYRDFFEFAQPGVPFLYRAMSTALGSTIASMNVVLLGLALFGSILVFMLARRVLPEVWAEAAALFASGLGIQINSPTYHIVAAILLIAAVLLLQGSDASLSVSLLRVCVSGLCCGVAIISMQSEGIAGWLVLFWWLGRKTHRWQRALFPIAAGVPPACLAAYFAAHGAVREWLHYTCVFAIRQAPLGTWSGMRSMVDSWYAVFAEHGVTFGVRVIEAATIGVATPMACAGVVFWSRAPGLVRLLGILALSQMAALAYGISLDRMQVVLLPGYLVLFWWLRRLMPSRALVAIANVLVIGVFTRSVVHAQRAPAHMLQDRFANEAIIILDNTEPIAARTLWIIDHTRPGETVALYAWDNELALLGDVRNPGRFLWLDEGGFNSADEVAATIAAIQQAKPRVARWADPIDLLGESAAIRHLQPLRDYLLRCYCPAGNSAPEGFLLRTASCD